MKKLLLLIIVLAAIYSCGTKDSRDNNQVKINGKLTNLTDDKVIVSYNIKTDTIKANSDGSFETTISIDRPCYVLIKNANNEALTFLCPGNNVLFEADADNFIKTLTFKDDNAEINNYLAEQNRIYFNKVVEQNGFVYFKTYDEFLKAYNSYVADYEKNLQNISGKYDKNFDSFKKAESEKLKLIKLSILTDFLFHTWDTEIETPDDAFDDLQKLESEIDIDNPDLMFFKQYWPFLSDLLTNKTSTYLRDAGIDDISMEEYGKYYFEEIDRNFKDKQVIEDVYFYFIKQFIQYYGPLSITEVFEHYKEFSQSKERIEHISTLLAEYETIAPGKPSVDWTFEDINGKSVSQSDFKGKYIYIDVWASWCAPCRAEIPYLEELKTKFAGKNIVFVSISVDDDEESWKQALIEEKVAGIQLYAGGWSNELCKYYKINSIPRFILIDKDLKIVNSDADRPSGEIEQIISNLEGI